MNEQAYRTVAVWTQFEVAVFVATMVAAAILVTFPILNEDIFWHMANGRAMVQEGKIVNEEILSYTANGSPFPNREWLAQILFYIVYDRGGIAGLLALKALLVMGTALLLFAAARQFVASPPLISLIVIFVILSALERFTVRPQLFSFLLLSLTQFLLYACRSGRLRWQYMLVLPFLIVILDFLHGSVYGLIFISAFLAGETAKYFLSERSIFPRFHSVSSKGFLKRLWMASILVFVGWAVNPYGLKTHLATFLPYVQRRGMMASYTLEFLPVTLGSHPLFWALLGVLAVLSLVFVRKLDLTHLFILVPFTAMALKFNRATAVFALVSVPVLAYYGRLIARSLVKPVFRISWSACVLALLVFQIGYLINYKFYKKDHFYAYGMGLNEERYPVGGARFVQEANLQGNMYNMGWVGGYLAFTLGPERKIFAYNHHMIFEQILSASHQPGVMDRYNINYGVVVRLSEFHLFFEKEKWVPIFWDKSSYVAIKNMPQNREVIDRYGLHYLTPDVDAEELMRMEADPAKLPGLLREVASTLSYSHDREKAKYLSQFLLRSDTGIKISEAIGMAQMGLRYNQDNAHLWHALGELYFQAGEFDQAENALRESIALDREMIPSQIALGFALLRQGKYTPAKERFQEALAFQEDNPETYMGLGFTYQALGRYEDAKQSFAAVLRLAPTGPLADSAKRNLAALENK